MIQVNDIIEQNNIRYSVIGITQSAYYPNKRMLTFKRINGNKEFMAIEINGHLEKIVSLT